MEELLVSDLGITGQKILNTLIGGVPKNKRYMMLAYLCVSYAHAISENAIETQAEVDEIFRLASIECHKLMQKEHRQRKDI